MTTTPGHDWIWIAAGAALGVIALVLLVWALFWDRPRGRKRCPNCWYDMQGAEADERGAFTCPECGRTITRERRLRGTRRRWWWAMVAVVLLLTCGAGMWHVVSRRPWQEFVPGGILVRVAPLTPIRSTARPRRPPSVAPFGSISEKLAAELVRRLQSEPGFLPRHFDTYLNRVQSDPSRSSTRLLYVRDRWPRGLPFVVYVRRDPLFIGDGPELMLEDARIRIRPDMADESWISIPGWPDFESVTIEADPSNLDRLAVAIEVELSDSRVLRGRSLPTEIVESIDDVLTPVKSDMLDDHVGHDLVSELRRANDGLFNLRLWFAGQFERERPTVGLAVEIRRGARVVATGRILFPATESGSMSVYSQNWVNLAWNVPELRIACDDSTHDWTLVVRGDPEVSLLDLDSDEYWAGEVQVEFYGAAIDEWCERYGDS